ncbi:MAG: hypothetical protein P8Z70_10715 [Desulfuromonadales bacterium]
MTPTQRILEKIIALQTAHPKWTVCIALLLAVFSLVYTARNLEFLTSQKALISPDNRLVRLSKQIDPFDDFDRFVVVIEGQSAERSRKFLNELVPLLQADRKHYQEVFYRFDPDQFRSWQLLYLNHKELSDLRELFSVPSTTKWPPGWSANSSPVSSMKTPHVPPSP